MRITLFVLMMLLMQLFTFGLGRSLQWLFAHHIGRRGRRALMLAAFAVTDGLIAGLLLELGSGLFRWMAVWMVVMLFVMYAALATFLLYLALRRLLPAQRLGRALRLFAPLFFLALSAYSVYNAYTPQVRRLSITVNKPMPRPLRIAMASDLHLGMLMGARQLDKLAAVIRDERADIVLLPGDIMDDDTRVYDAENMRPHLAAVRAPLGVYATLGNHDMYGHADEIRRALREAGIRELDNEVINLDGILLAGRTDDVDANRPSTAELLRGQNTALPVILLDHRPSQIEEHARLPVDIQLSGHVHNGQIAPANLIVRFLYRLHYGYEAIGNGHYIVSSGYGFWGVPFRLGSQAEVWIIDVKGR